MSIVSLPQYIHSRRASEQAPARREQLEAVAEQFEAIFLQQILKQMRKAGNALAAEDSMRNRELALMHDLHDEVLAQHLAQKRQTGIADMLVKQLGGRLEAGDLAMRGEWQQAAFESMIASVVRHESAGDPAAVSPKGARGLMQLMPATAREMAADLGLEYDEERLTSDPAYNQQLGSAYLGKLLARYDGHKALAVAAYNAGPGRVDQWLQQLGDPREGEIDTAAWIERLPYAETRSYTRSIMRDLQAGAAAVEARQPQSAQRGWHGGDGLAAPIRFPLTANGPVQVDILTQFKPSADVVALHDQGRTAAPVHMSAAFAQPLRIETKEESL